MFSVLAAGRLPQVNFQQVSETQFVIPIPDVDHVNHLVVFMTGQMPFPDHLGGGGNWPSIEGPTWIFLGKITNTKPSAIFKINKIKDNEPNASSTLTPAMFSSFVQHPSSIPSDGLLGISVEPLTQLDQQTQPADIAPTTVASNVEFVSKMLNNFVNYVTSFVQSVPGTSEQIVPLSVIQTWFNNFQRRLNENPNFWKGQN